MEKQIIAICGRCRAIRINKKYNLWLDKDDDVDFKLYDLYMGNPKRVLLSHGLCPEDGRKDLQDVLNLLKE